MIAAFALLLMAGPADAYDGMSSVDATRAIAACVVKRGRADAIAVAGTDPAAPEYKKIVHRIEGALTACLKAKATSLSIRVNDLRGVLAESFLKEDNGSHLARARGLTPVTPQRVTFGNSGALNDATLFRCVVDAAPAEAVALMLAQPASVEEGSAFRRMAPSLQGCVPEQAAVHLKPFQVRLLVAAALYGRLTALPGA